MDKFSFYPALLCLSCVGLAATILVYLLLPELRNLPGKNSLSVAGSLLGAFLLLVLEQVYVSVDSVTWWICIGLGNDEP